MKTTIRFIASILFFFLTLNSNAQFISANVQVSGLTCSMCSKATEKALRTLDFVQDIQVDLENTSYNLTFKKDKTVSIDQIALKVQHAGFSVNKLVAYFDFKTMEAPKDFHYKFENNIYHFMNASNNKVSGKTAITFIDKGFLPNKDFEKYKKMTSFMCYNTGYLEKCCPMSKEGKTRVYHILL